MASHAFGKFLPALKLRLGIKAVISAVLLIAVNTALVVGAAYWSLTASFDERALRDIEVNLRTLTLAFGEQFKDARITLKDGVVSHVEIAQSRSSRTMRLSIVRCPMSAATRPCLYMTMRPISSSAARPM